MKEELPVAPLGDPSCRDPHLSAMTRPAAMAHRGDTQSREGPLAGRLAGKQAGRQANAQADRRGSDIEVLGERRERA